MLKIKTAHLTFVFSMIVSLQCFAVQVSSKPKKFERTRTFLEESFKSIRKFINNSKNQAIDFSIKCKPPGGAEFVISEASFFFKSTNYFFMNVSGECPYKTVVSNNLVYTTFTKTGETDIRPLETGEKIFEDFLGVSHFVDQSKFIFHFTVEDNLYVVSAVLKPEVCTELSLELHNNARKALKRQLWVDTAKDKVVKSQVITLEGKETFYYY